jgi:hypothetical protein
MLPDMRTNYDALYQKNSEKMESNLISNYCREAIIL